VVLINLSDGIIQCCNRPFNKCKDMHKRILHSYNSLVKDEDHVYILGDVYWKRSIEELSRIMGNYKGHKHLILGNHDLLRPFDYEIAGFCQVSTWLYVEEFILVHDPVKSIVYSQFPDNKYLCGHVHTLFKKIKNVLNVGVDQWNFYPVSIDQVRKEFREWKN